jgi:lantibiotic biosynthesis protein
MKTLINDTPNTAYSIDESLEKLIALLYDFRCQNDSVWSGSIGQLLYASYFYKYSDKPEWGDKALGIIETLFDKLENMDNPSLYGASLANGISSLGFVLTIMEHEGIGDFDEQLGLFDKIIYDGGIRLIEKNNTDYLYGITGTLNYLSLRTNHLSVKKYLEHLVELLAAKVINTPKGSYFPNSHLEDMSPKNIEIDFGLAHGQCGILLTLLKIYEQNIASEKLENILVNGVNFILNHQTNTDFQNGKYSFFPVKFNEDFAWDSPQNYKMYSNRLGWCYGDLNQLLLLYRAGKTLNKPQWVLLADKMGEIVVQRKKIKETDIYDSHFCHGSSGLVQFYKRLFEASQNTQYLDTANYWLNATMVSLEKEMNTYNQERYGELLMGFGATSLVLLSEIHKESQHWDSIFLLS